MSLSGELVAVPKTVSKLPDNAVGTKADVRQVQVKYWVCPSHSSPKDKTAHRALPAFRWKKSYVPAKVILTKILEDDNTMNFLPGEALFLFIKDIAKPVPDDLPEVKPSDVFSLQTGLTTFQIQVIPQESTGFNKVTRTTLSLSASAATTLTVSSFNAPHGTIRYWKPEVQSYLRLEENNKVELHSTMETVDFLIEQSVPALQEGGNCRDLTVHHHPHPQAYASIFSRLVDHHRLAEVVHTQTFSSDWHNATQALSLGFLAVKRTKKDPTVRQFLWNGVPHLYRRKFWLALSGGLETMRKHPRSYDAALSIVFSNKHRYVGMNVAASLMPHSLAPDEANVPTFGALDWTTTTTAYPILNPEGQRQFKVLLCCLKEGNPSLKCSPVIAPLAAAFLLFMSAEEAYSAINCMIHESTKIKTGCEFFLRTSQEDYHLILSWIDNILETHCPWIHAHLKKIGYDMAKLYSGWLHNFFQPHYPMYGTLHVIDVFLAEGVQALIKILIATCHYIQKAILKCNTVKAVDDKMTELLCKEQDVTTIIKRAYSSKNISFDEFKLNELTYSENDAFGLEAKNQGIQLSNNTMEDFEFDDNRNKPHHIQPIDHSAVSKLQSVKLRPNSRSSFSGTFPLANINQVNIISSSSHSATPSTTDTSQATSLPYNTPSAITWHNNDDEDEEVIEINAGGGGQAAIEWNYSATSTYNTTEDEEQEATGDGRQSTPILTEQDATTLPIPDIPTSKLPWIETEEELLATESTIQAESDTTSVSRKGGNTQQHKQQQEGSDVEGEALVLRDGNNAVVATSASNNGLTAREATTTFTIAQDVKDAIARHTKQSTLGPANPFHEGLKLASPGDLLAQLLRSQQSSNNNTTFRISKDSLTRLSLPASSPYLYNTQAIKHNHTPPLRYPVKVLEAAPQITAPHMSEPILAGPSPHHKASSSSGFPTTTTEPPLISSTSSHSLVPSTTSKNAVVPLADHTSTKRGDATKRQAAAPVALNPTANPQVSRSHPRSLSKSSNMHDLKFSHIPPPPAQPPSKARPAVGMQARLQQQDTPKQP